MNRIYFVILTILTLCLPKAWAQTDDPDILEFAMISDTHHEGPSADVRYAEANMKAFVQYCRTTPGLQFALHGGDFMNAYDTNHEQALWCLEHGRRDFLGLGIPMYVTKGNHDCNGKQWTADGKRDNSQIVTDHEFFELFNPLSPTNPLADSTDIVCNPEDREGNYYYRDFPRQRVRMIVLNDYDKDSLEWFGYHGRQVKWLAEHALNFEDKDEPERWCFMMLGHSFSVNILEHPISRLLHAYVRGEDFSDSDSGYSYHARFNKMRRAKMVALLGGHHHEDIYRWSEDYNMISVNRGFATGGEVGVPEEEVCFDHFVLNVREQTLEERRIGRGRSRKYSYAPPAILEPLQTFPEADGAGIYTRGGGGGRTVYVTNLDDHGPGSLRWALEQKGSRRILFKVGGEIRLESPLVIANDSVSVCGHSAPNPGISISGNDIRVTASEVILRYFRLRGGGISDGDFGQHNLLWDHLSVSFSDGPCISVRRAKDVTVQYCLLSHPLTPEALIDTVRGLTNVPPPVDVPAALVAGGFVTTYCFNVIANAPIAVAFPSREGENRWIHFVRNVIYNWRDHALMGGGRQGEITIEENYLLPSHATLHQSLLDVSPDGTGRYYTWGNAMKGHDEYSRQNRRMVDDHVGFPYDPVDYDEELRQQMDPSQRPIKGDFAASCLTVAAFHYKPFFDRPTKNTIFRNAMVGVGCSIERDAYDTALLEHLKADEPFGSHTGLIATAGAVGSFPSLPTTHHEPPTGYDNETRWMDQRAAANKSIVVLYESEPLCNVEAYPRLAGYRDAISTDTAHVAIVSCGDFLNGGVISSLSRGKYIIDIMRHTRYDALTLGNYDFDYSVADQQQTLEPLRDAVVCCNLIDRQTGNPVYAPYVIRQYGRRKVAFVGLTTPQSLRTRTLAFVDSEGKLRYDLCEGQLCQVVQQAADAARREGADYVVLLSHIGTGKIDQREHIRNIIEGTTGIDVVLDSHRNDKGDPGTLYRNRDNRPVICSAAGDHLRSVGKLVIAPDGLITTEILPPDHFRFKNPGATMVLDSIQSIFADYIAESVGVAECDVPKWSAEEAASMPLSETCIGNLVTDALRVLTDADVAIINSGGIRQGLKAGQILRKDMLNVAPFDNKVITLSVTGAQLKLALQAMAQRLDKNRLLLLQVSGLRYKLYPGQGVSDVKVLNRQTGRYESLDNKAVYTLATLDYCLYDDAYGSVFERSPRLASFPIYSELLSQYISQHLNGHVGKEYGAPQHRIRVMKQGNK